MPSATRPSTATDWVASLDPWPEEFGLDRMRALLAALGDPQRAFPSIHVVGTNGKSTATRTIAELLRAEGLRAGAYTSPHVSGWHERLDCDPASFERAVARVRGSAEQLGATQFEVLTAAALAEFAEAGVDVAVVEAGLGGRLDATNVVDAPVVQLTNVALEHTEVLGDTPEEIAKEKLAVAHAARVVVMSDNTFEHLVPAGATAVVGGAKEAAEAFLERPRRSRGRRRSFQADSSGEATKYGTARTRRRPSTGSSPGYRRATTSSASRSSATSGSTRCSSV